MNLKSLLLSSDEKIVRVLRRTLGDLEIDVEHCTNSEGALRFLTRDRFEAIIVDCADDGAAEVLRGARAAACNKRAVAVAILDVSVGLQSAFANGAHFTLYKPVSAERARSSFRAARALMKKERRRNSRVPLQIPLEMASAESDIRLRVTTVDIGEGGLAVSLPKKTRRLGRWNMLFTLPGTNQRLEIPAEFAWEGSGKQVGLRFVNGSPEAVSQLRDWLKRNSPDAEMDDPPVRCQLTDLSLYGCYVEVASPFPVSARVTLTMKVPGAEVKIEGVVRVMHADKGMGVEFSHNSPAQKALIEKFLTCLGQNPDAQPELLVEPEALETDAAPDSAATAAPEDPLIHLFRNHAELGVELFQAELRKQRGMAAAAGA
ncbi:MAG TPA: PilZ domain-containing protein [Candidatus Sulfotelmatobacter sp.]|jgi:CheY-like chemotaxis protein